MSALSARSLALFPAALLNFRFFLGDESSPRHCTQPLERDRQATLLAQPVSPFVHLAERAVDLREPRTLLICQVEQLLLLLRSLGSLGRVPHLSKLFRVRPFGNVRCNVALQLGALGLERRSKCLEICTAQLTVPLLP